MKYHDKHEALAHNLIEAAFVCRDWHSGQWSGCYAVQCGQWEHLTAGDLDRAAWELQRHLDTCTDDYCDCSVLLDAIDALRDAAAEWEAVLSHQ